MLVCLENGYLVIYIFKNEVVDKYEKKVFFLN